MLQTSPFNGKSAAGRLFDKSLLTNCLALIDGTTLVPGRKVATLFCSHGSGGLGYCAFPLRVQPVSSRKKKTRIAAAPCDATPHQNSTGHLVCCTMNPENVGPAVTASKNIKVKTAKALPRSCKKNMSRSSRVPTMAGVPPNNPLKRLATINGSY